MGMPLRLLILLPCLLLLIFPRPAGARRMPEGRVRTVALIPLQDGSADVTTKELAQSLTTALPRLGPIRVLDAARVRAVKGEGAPAQRPPLADGLEAAKKAYLRFANREALAHVDAIVQQYRAHPEWSARHGEILTEALLTKALIHHSEHAVGRMTSTLQDLALAAPFLTLDEAHYPPTLRNAWHKVREQQRSGGAGSLTVESRPSFAEVRVNGMKVGVTPLKDVALPEGSYQLTIAAPHYQPQSTQVQVRAHRTTTTRARLHWQRTTPSRETGRSLQGTIDGGLQVAEQLKADAAIMVDVDQPTAGRGTITLRVLDRFARASFPPLTTPVSTDRAALHARLAAMTQQLAAQVTDGALARPHALDQIETGRPALLTSRKRRVSPWVWAAVGSAVGGGLLAGLLLGGGGSGGPATGGLVLQLR